MFVVSMLFSAAISVSSQTFYFDNFVLDSCLIEASLEPANTVPRNQCVGCNKRQLCVGFRSGMVADHATNFMLLWRELKTESWLCEM